MKWNQFRLKTTTEAEDIVSSMLMDLGIQGVQIEDKVPLTEQDKEQMFVDILPQIPADDGVAYLTFYLEEEEDPEAVLERIRRELEEMRSYVDVGECTIEESQTEDVDWVNNWKKYFHQFSIDDILVIPSWEQVEAKENPEDKLFIFNVTMQNHGGYEYGADNFQEEIRMTGELAGYEQTDRYLSLMKKSDEAFAYLLEYFSEVEEPTMIVMFGDHQAAVETEVYESLFGKPLSELSPEEADRRYITPLIIWTNYEQQEGWIDKISANYLGSLILDLANLELTPYNQILLETWEELPALGKNGYYLADGSYVAWSADTEEPEQMRRYHLIEYNGVADRRNRRDVLFRIEPQGGM